MSLTIAEALKQATTQLQAVSDSARLDAEVLLAHVLKKDRVHFLTWPEKPISELTYKVFLDLVNRRVEGEPIAYIIDQQEFWSIKLRVTPDTLIPRPETELLVLEALNLLKEDERYKIADLGTGSGAIAIAIASERPLCTVIGIDQSRMAVKVADRNAASLGLKNVTIRQGDWLTDFADHSLDMIVTNPPYVAENDPHLAEGDVRFEPSSALLAGPEGMNEYRKIIPEAVRCLKKHGWILLEHGYDQQDKLLDLLTAEGFTEARGIKDYAGQPRVIIAHT
ncbi:MAG: peptide chain release factor N(5)-glutamine methyltransferase [Gammaproteobacteria bacterium]|nr:peptide chain release factor N(5)-glutamine methyltransferase [Gammaproteobacteria bacterium]